jgi:hypothetical protein
MGVQPPFLYDAVKHKDFDPRAASRASMQSSRAPPRPKQEGPLVSFNQHPEYVAYQSQLLDACSHLLQFIPHHAIWKHECEADESLSQEMDQGDAGRSIGSEMSGDTSSVRTISYDDLDSKCR